MGTMLSLPTASDLCNNESVTQCVAQLVIDLSDTFGIFS